YTSLHNGRRSSVTRQPHSVYANLNSSSLFIFASKPSSLGLNHLQKAAERPGLGDNKSQIGHTVTVRSTTSIDEGSEFLSRIATEEDKQQFFALSKDGSSAVSNAFEKLDLNTLKNVTEKLGLQQCLADKTAKNQSVLHRAAFNTTNPQVFLWLTSIVGDKQQFFARDSDGVSAVSNAFSELDLETLQQVTKIFGLPQCLATKTAKNESVLHRAAFNAENPAVFLWLSSIVEDKQQFFALDNYGYSAVSIAFSTLDLATLTKVTEKLGLQQCLSAKTAKNQSVLHRAAFRKANPEVFLWLIDIVEDKQQFFAQDYGGFMAVSIAFEKLDLITLKKVTDKLGLQQCLAAKTAKNESVLYRAALNAANPAVLLWLLSIVKDKQQFFFLNDHGYSAVSAAFLKLDLDTLKQVTEKLGLQQCLAAKTAKKQSVLHRAAFNTKNPAVFLWLIDIVEDKQQFFVLDDFGYSAVSDAFSFLDLDTLEQVTKKLGLQQCLAAKTAKNDSVLHRAAFNTAKPSVFLWLIAIVEDKQQFFVLDDFGYSAHDAKLEDETAAGQTCVDFACNKEMLEVLFELADDINEIPKEKSFTLRELLKLVDVAKRALKLPDKQSARNYLTQFNDSSLKASIEDDMKKGQEAGMMPKSEESAEVQMLFRAFELDSTEMLRSLISLGFAIDEIDEQFSLHILTQIRKNQQGSKSPIIATLQQFFSERDRNSKTLVLMEYAILLEKPKLLTDLMLLPQFDIIPQTLRLLIYLKLNFRSSKSETMQKVQFRALNVVVNILDHLYVDGDEDDRKNLFNYLTGSFCTSGKQSAAGPRFLPPIESVSRPAKKPSNEVDKEFVSVMHLVETLDCDDLFATDCISNLVDQQWKKPPPLPWSSSPHCCTGKRPEGATIQQRYVIHAVSFLLFLLYFAWYVTDFSRTKQSPVPDIILLSYALSFTLQEINDFLNNMSLKDVTIFGRHLKVPGYFTDLFNYFDMAGLLLMWAGLVLKLRGELTGPILLRSSQVVLSASFLLLGFRSVALLSYFKVTGPKINMLKSLLFKDLLPFILILLVLVYSFGIFFFNLLFPAFSDSRDAQALTKVFTVPVSLAFGIFESVIFESCNPGTLATGKNFLPNEKPCADEEGKRAYDGILMFVYLLLVNIVMWNLLIALFSRTVTKLASRAEVLWRKNLFELLREFAEVSPVPPPLSFPHYAWKLLRRCRCERRSGRVGPDGSEPWWQNKKDFSGYPEGYKRFLIYQAKRLREHRPRLQRPVERHKGDTDVLKAHVENQAQDLRDDVLTAQREDNARIEAHLKDSIDSIETQLNEKTEEIRQRQRKHRRKTKKQLSEITNMLKQMQQQMQRHCCCRSMSAVKVVHRHAVVAGLEVQPL
uniref:Ion_trans domain-containing protein n=1 Tax=Macrostomum lignano TaxID=282301 RepID=A0A1I8J8S0_9PLAT